MNQEKGIPAADLVIRNVHVYNSCFKQFRDGDVYVKDGRIYYVDEKRCGESGAVREVDGEGKYLIPGLIDIHMHIESSMVTPAVFADYVVSRGLTTLVTEPHEMANVMGRRGILDMIESAKEAPIDIYYGTPSSVPVCGPQIETSGGVIDAEDMIALKKNPMVKCVGEVMQYRGVIEPENNLEISKYIHYIKQIEQDEIFPVEGHCPALKDFELARFLYTGINSDHTEHDLEEFRQRFLNGMFVEIQDKTLTKELIDYIKENRLFEHFSFVTDDTLPDVLADTGHLDALVRKAISLGLSPEEAIYNATYTPARRMNLLDRGTLVPGKLADMILLDDPRKFGIAQVYKRGRLVYDCRQPIVQHNHPRFADVYYHSVQLKKPDPEVFRIHTEIENGYADVQVMEILRHTTRTRKKTVRMPVRDHQLQWQGSGCLLTMVFERYGKNGNIGYAFSTGDGLKRGAAASSYAHDCHNVLVCGASEEEMKLAVDRIIDLQGGIVCVDGGKITAEVKLPVGGILADTSVEETAADFRKVRRAFEEQGYVHENSVMSFLVLPLTCSPELKVSDKGLIDVEQGKVIPLFEEHITE